MTDNGTEPKTEVEEVVDMDELIALESEDVSDLSKAITPDTPDDTIASGDSQK